eukprot:m.478027 g.478027  ORF g.478027 m.478027 type:complete len:56 (-) comp45457_c0_seq1:192-359(-)
MCCDFISALLSSLREFCLEPDLCDHLHMPNCDRSKRACQCRCLGHLPSLAHRWIS